MSAFQFERYGLLVAGNDEGVTIAREYDAKSADVTLTREQAAWLFRSAGPAVLYEIDRPPLRRAPGSG
jgi:hypothetical protein